MRAMLSFTICGALLISIVPCARTAGACMARARPTAAVNVEAANKRRFMTFTSPVAFRGRNLTEEGSTEWRVWVRGGLKNFFFFSRRFGGVSCGGRLRNRNPPMWVQMDHRNKEVLLGGEPS